MSDSQIISCSNSHRETMESGSDTEMYPEKVLDDPPESDEVEAFARELLNIERCLLELETDVTQEPIGITGIRASRRFSDLEERHRELVLRLNRFQSAVMEGTVQPTDIETNNGPEFRQRARAGEFDTYLDRLNKLATRVGQRLDSRRNSANTRVGLTISVTAVVLSAVSIVLP